MKGRPNGLIERFYSKHNENKRVLFQLVKEKQRYCIKRGKEILVVTFEETKAKKGFRALRAKLCVYR